MSCIIRKAVFCIICDNKDTDQLRGNCDQRLLFFFLLHSQGWDKYCPTGKFQWKIPENAGMANTPKITEVANTGIYEQN